MGRPKGSQNVGSPRFAPTHRGVKFRPVRAVRKSPLRYGSIGNVSVRCACGFLHAKTNMNTNGPPVASPTDVWGPGRGGGAVFGGGGNPSGPAGNFCYCKSTSPTSIWPLCCKKKT